MDHQSPTARPASRGFFALLVTQALGAFNDNLFKNALIILFTFRLTPPLRLLPEQWVALAGAVFIAPFFLFSAFAGQLADRFPKAALSRGVKLAEVAISLLAAAGLVLENSLLLLAVLGLMGVQSALFGPLKYGILPELLPQERLIFGNALVETGTFLAILLGTVVGGSLITVPTHGCQWVAGLTVLTAVLGAASASAIPRGPAAEPALALDLNPWRANRRLLTIVQSEPRSVAYALLGISWFWFVGAAVLSMLPKLAQTLGGGANLVTYLLALFSVGVALGSWLCERLSGRQLELGLVPIGSLGMTLCLAWVAWALPDQPPSPEPFSLEVLLHSQRGAQLSLGLICFAVSSGLFTVPLYTLLQERSSHAQRARLVAANNILNALFMVGSAILLFGAFSAGVTLPQLFGALALLNLLVATHIYRLIPEFLFRFLCFTVGHLCYRLRIQGKQHIPSTGAAVLICNHVTFIDWLLLSLATHRPQRFVMHHSFAKLPGLGWFFRDAKVIPIAGAQEDPAQLELALQRIHQELLAGELVCLFPEGRLTTDGSVQTFRRGIERVVTQTPVPVIPLALRGLWGSRFSRHPRANRRSHLWPRVDLTIGPALAPQLVTASLLETQVRAMVGGTLQQCALPGAATPTPHSAARPSESHHPDL